MTDEAAVLAAIALLSNRLDYCNSLFRSLSIFNMHKMQCIQNTLGRIVTNCNRYSQTTPILKKFQLNFGVFSKLPLWFTSFFTVVTQAISGLICLFLGTRYNRPDKVPQYYPSVHKFKNHFSHSFAFYGSTL